VDALIGADHITSNRTLALQKATASLDLDGDKPNALAFE
jgi:hypothetical protein